MARGGSSVARVDRRPLPWSDEQLDALAEVNPGDREAAAALWDSAQGAAGGLPDLSGLLDAAPPADPEDE